jgi:hypothetical protein
MVEHRYTVSDISRSLDFIVWRLVLAGMISGPYSSRFLLVGLFKVKGVFYTPSQYSETEYLLY